MSTRRQFIKSVPAVGAAFAVAGRLMLEDSSAQAQTGTRALSPLGGHFHPKGKAPSRHTLNVLEQARVCCERNHQQRIPPLHRVAGIAPQAPTRAIGTGYAGGAIRCLRPPVPPTCSSARARTSTPCRMISPAPISPARHVRWAGACVRSFELGRRLTVPAPLMAEPILKGIADVGYYVWRGWGDGPLKRPGTVALRRPG